MDKIDSFREPGEPDDHWLIRKEFIEKNWSSFPKAKRNRLLALAQCYKNIQILGCSYPAPVMLEVERLAEGLSKDIIERKKEKVPKFTKVAFVAAGSCEDPVVLDDDDDIAMGSDEDEPDAQFKGFNMGGKTKSKSMQKKGFVFGKNDSVDCSSSGNSKSAFVFGKSGYTNMFVKSSSTDVDDVTTKVKDRQEFCFGGVRSGLGFQCSPAVDSTGEKPSGNGKKGFVFGGVAGSSRDYTSGLGFVKENTQGADSQDGLRRKLEDCSVDTLAPRNKSPKLDSNYLRKVFDEILSIRNDLKTLSPPLNERNVDFCTTQLKLHFSIFGDGLIQEDSRKGKSVTSKLKYRGIKICETKDSNVYKMLTKLVNNDEKWFLVELPNGEATISFGKHDNTRISETSNTRAAHPSPKAKPNPSEQNRISQQTMCDPSNARVYGFIIKSLIDVRNTMRTNNYRNKIDMLGELNGSNTATAISMAFQMTNLRPIKDAPKPGTMLKFDIKSNSSNSGGNSFICRLLFHGVILATGFGATKNDAKAIAAEKLFGLLPSYSRMEIVDGPDGPEVRFMVNGRDDRTAQFSGSGPGLTKQSGSAVPSLYNDLIIVRRHGNSPQSILQVFANVNDIPHQFKINSKLRDDQQVFDCTLTLNLDPPLVFEFTGSTREEARNGAAKMALQTFIPYCYTVYIQSKVSDDAQQFDKNSMPIGLESDSVRAGLDKCLDNDNIGSKLLKAMGWSGGGLGAGGTGIIEPIMLLDNSAQKKGLGYKGGNTGTSKMFHSHVSAVLRAFLRDSDVFDELRFSADFSNIERKDIHQMARKMGLTSKSSNLPEGRVLCVSHTMDWKSMVERLKSSPNGKSGKFVLIPPGGWTL